MKEWLNRNWPRAARTIGLAVMVQGLLWHDPITYAAGLGAAVGPLAVGGADAQNPWLARGLGFASLLLSALWHEGLLVIAGLGAMGLPTAVGKDA